MQDLGTPQLAGCMQDYLIEIGGLVMHGKRARGDGLGVFAWRMYPGKVAFVCLGILVI